jgi:hypothetical protein
MVRRSLSYLGSRNTKTLRSASHARNYLFYHYRHPHKTIVVTVNFDRHHPSDQETVSETRRFRQPSTSQDRDPRASSHSNITAKLSNSYLHPSLYTLSRVPATVDITGLRKRHLGSAETRIYSTQQNPSHETRRLHFLRSARTSNRPWSSPSVWSG